MAIKCQVATISVFGFMGQFPTEAKAMKHLQKVCRDTADRTNSVIEAATGQRPTYKGFTA